MKRVTCQKLCGTFGCTLPDRHAGLHVPTGRERLEPRRRPQSYKAVHRGLRTSAYEQEEWTTAESTSAKVGDHHQVHPLDIPNICAPGSCSCNATRLGEHLVDMSTDEQLQVVLQVERLAAERWKRQTCDRSDFADEAIPPKRQKLSDFADEAVPKIGAKFTWMCVPIDDPIVSIPTPLSPLAFGIAA